MMKQRYLSFLLVLLLLFTSCQGENPIDKGSDPVTSETETESTTVMPTYDDVTLTTFDKLLIHGRMLPPDEEGLRIDWTYSGFTLRGWFDGPLVANVFSEGELGFVFRVEVDGGESVPQRVGLGEKTITLATLEKGYHTVTVRKVTEGSTSRVILRSLSFKGQLDEPPEAPDLKIEIIGASTSCGVGSYPEAVTNWDYLTHCDSYYAYTTMVARELGADLNFVSVSGWGLVYGSGSADKRIPAIYSLTSYVSDRETQWDFDSWQADVVIITLGGNDRSAPTMYKQSYIVYAQSFLKTVREAYPNAYILWHYGDANEELVPHIKAAVEQMNDDRMAYLGRPRNSEGGWSHANYETHLTYAQDVLAHLTPILEKK